MPFSWKELRRKATSRLHWGIPRHKQEPRLHWGTALFQLMSLLGGETCPHQPIALAKG